MRPRGSDSLPSRISRQRATVWLAVGILAILGYGALWPSAPILDGDSAQYMEVARDLSDGRLDALHDRTPGYPALLAVTGSADRPTRALLYAGLALHVACVWMLAWALQAAGGSSPLVALLSVVLLLPPYVEPAGYVMTENLAQTMIVGAFFAMMCWSVSGRVAWAAAAGLALAAAAMTRPAYQALAPVLAVILVTGVSRYARGASLRRSAAAAIALIVTSALSVAPYVWFNNRHFGFTGVTFSTGFHLSTKTMGFVERLPDRDAAVREILIRERDAQLTKRGGPHTHTQTIWSVREALQEATGLSRPELSRHMLQLNLALIRAAPVEYLQEVARSAAVYWFPAFMPLSTFDSGLLRWTWAALHLLIVLLLAVQLMAAGGVAVYRRVFAAEGARIGAPFDITAAQAQAYRLAAAIVLYTMAVSCAVDIGEPRQRRPTDVLAVFMCAVGLQVWQQNRRKSHDK